MTPADDKKIFKTFLFFQVVNNREKNLQFSLAIIQVRLRNSRLVFVSPFKCRSSHWTCSVKNGVLRSFAKFTEKQLYQRIFKACNFIKKEFLAQVFSCEFCEISTNTFFTEHLRTTASTNAILIHVRIIDQKPKSVYVSKNTYGTHMGKAKPHDSHFQLSS